MNRLAAAMLGLLTALPAALCMSSGSAAAPQQGAGKPAQQGTPTGSIGATGEATMSTTRLGPDGAKLLRVSASISPTTATLGDVVHARLVAEAPAKHLLVRPDIGDSIGTLRVAAVLVRDQIVGLIPTQQLELHLLLVPTEPGTATVPALTFAVRSWAREGSGSLVGPELTRASTNPMDVAIARVDEAPQLETRGSDVDELLGESSRADRHWWTTAALAVAAATSLASAFIGARVVLARRRPGVISETIASLARLRSACERYAQAPTNPERESTTRSAEHASSGAIAGEISATVRRLADHTLVAPIRSRTATEVLIDAREAGDAPRAAWTRTLASLLADIDAVSFSAEPTKPQDLLALIARAHALTDSSRQLTRIDRRQQSPRTGPRPTEVPA
jgi:hypothetical protein